MINRTGYKLRRPKWQWRKFLTPEEQDIIARADAAKSAWRQLNRDRAMITNRAIQRAKYAEAGGSK